MLHIEREIAQQPNIIRHLLAADSAHMVKIAQAIAEFDPAFVMISARGTSDNAARYAQYAFSIKLGLPVALAVPSVHTLYEAQPKLARALVIGISQSGSSPDVRQVVTDAKAQGALTLSITNNAQSPLANESHFHIDLQCGEEISVAATKTYTAELAAIAILINAIKPQEGLAQLPSYMEETLKYSEPISQWIQRYRYANHIATVGRGYNYCTAFEISLKIKELCYITGEEYSEADFRHGPIAIIQPGFPVIAVAPQGKPLALMVELLEQLKAKGAECLVISNDNHVQQFGQFVMPIAQSVPEWLSPLCSVIPGQIFAMHLALAKGHAVDTPQGLNKVTVTT